MYYCSIVNRYYSSVVYDTAATTNQKKKSLATFPAGITKIKLLDHFINNTVPGLNSTNSKYKRFMWLDKIFLSLNIDYNNIYTFLYF